MSLFLVQRAYAYHASLRNSRENPHTDDLESSRRALSKTNLANLIDMGEIHRQE